MSLWRVGSWCLAGKAPEMLTPTGTGDGQREPLWGARGRREGEEMNHFNVEQLFSSISVNERKLLL